MAAYVQSNSSCFVILVFALFFLSLNHLYILLAYEVQTSVRVTLFAKAETLRTSLTIKSKFFGSTILPEM